MNILFVHSIGKNKYGGGEKWLITAAAGLRDRGCNVYVGGRPGSRLLGAAGKRGLKKVELNILSDLSIWHIFKIAMFIRKNNIDVLITKGRDLAIAGVAAKISRNPLVLVRHGIPIQTSFRKHSFLLRKLADGIITNTVSIKDLYESKGLVKKGFTEVIYNGTEFSENTHTINFAEKYPGKKIVLTVGRLALQKGYRYLIDAIKMLADEQHNDLMFLVLGEGRLYSRLVSYSSVRGVADKIHFEGFVDNIAPYLQGCDIFVLPSLYEGMSNAAMEAMSYGKPVIMTDVNGASELVPDHTKGILIPPRDSRAIADAIIKLKDNASLKREIGIEAKRYIKLNFSSSKMIDRTYDYIYERVSAKRS